MEQQQSSPKFDPTRIITQAFSYLKHVRLMLVVFSTAILCGVSYFLYATPVFSSKSLIHFQSYGTPVRDSELPETGNYNAGVTLALLDRLKSQEIQIAAAHRLGLVGEHSTYEDLLDHIPSIVIRILDTRHMEVTVLAYNADVVRDYSEVLVQEFQRIQEESWKQFRDGALERYALQLKELEEKVAENTDALSVMERDQHFIQMTIEQQSLLEIPKEIVETQERIKRMDAVRETLEKYESEEAGEDNTIAILSILSSFEEDTKVDVGNLVQRSLSPGRAAVGPARPTEVQVVTPADVDSIEPWREIERRKRVTETQIREASVVLLPEHPKMREHQDELENLTRSLVSEMSVLREKFDLEYRRLKERLLQLEARIPEYQKVTEEFGKSSIQFNSIEQAQTMWDEARKRLASKLATVTFTDDFDWVQLNFKGHTSLRDDVPVSPNKRKLLMMTLLLGLGGAIGLPTLLNLLDSSARSLAQLEDYIGLKGIGIVPLTDPDFLEAVHRSPAQGAAVPNYILECFRVIRANIGLDSKFDGIASQVVLFTSARPQEGKTTLAANLAWAYHSMGEKVLLVDCDLRRGRQHLLLKLDNGAGMSKMLTGQISPENAIIHTEQKGFDAVPRGPIIAGSTELLCQEDFFKLVQYWRTRYDRIILDCPPVLGLSESVSLQRLADGVVLVVRSEKTPMRDVRDAVTVLRKTGAHFFGFVLNSVDLSKLGNYYQYYYYSAPYYDQFEGDPGEASEVPPRAAVAASPASLPPQRSSPEVSSSSEAAGAPPRKPQTEGAATGAPSASRPRPETPPEHRRSPQSKPRELTALAEAPGTAAPDTAVPVPKTKIFNEPRGGGAWSDSLEDQEWLRAREEEWSKQQDEKWITLERKPMIPRQTAPTDKP